MPTCDGKSALSPDLATPDLRSGDSASSIAFAESTKLATSILDHRRDLGADYLVLANEMRKRQRACSGGSRAP